MLTIYRGSDRLILVLHEVYGVNQHMKDVCMSLSQQNVDVICPNLLESVPFDSFQEKEAHYNFMSNVGFINAFHKVKGVLLDIQDKYSKVFILGFSVGATLAWLCCEEVNVDGVVGYYGSRIRDYVHMNPGCPTLLFFPQTEKSFNVNKVVSLLDKPNIEVHVCEGKHGFNDPYSAQYNKVLAQRTFNRTLTFFKNN